MIYDVLVVTNRVRDRDVVLKELGFSEDDPNVLSLSINQLNTADGLRFKELIKAPNLEVNSKRQARVLSHMQAIASTFR